MRKGHGDPGLSLGRDPCLHPQGLPGGGGSPSGPSLSPTSAVGARPRLHTCLPSSAPDSPGSGAKPSLSESLLIATVTRAIGLF